MNPRMFRTILVAAGLATLMACSGEGPRKETGSNDRPRSVRLATCEVRPMERVIAVSGSLSAQEQATISIKVPGRIQVLAVDIGSGVNQGDVLAQVEPRDYELRVQQSAAALAQVRAMAGLALEGTDDAFAPDQTSAVRQARALLDEAAKNKERIESLFKAGVLPKSEFETAESVYSVAVNRHAAALEEAHTRRAALAQRRAEFEIAKQQLADSTVRAPFTGVVQARLVHFGEFLAAGAPVVELVKADPLRLRLEVPERDAASVRSGQKVRLTVEDDTNVYAGVLARISPAIDDRTRVLVVEADVPGHPGLRPGLFARARIVVTEEDRGLAVPQRSLVVFAGIEKVVCLHQGKAVEKTVITGRRGDDWIEIVSGLRAGERVVITPGNLRSGQLVSAGEPSGESAPPPAGP